MKKVLVLVSVLALALALIPPRRGSNIFAAPANPLDHSLGDMPVALPDAQRPEEAADALNHTPLLFIENVGQFDKAARFQVHGAQWRMYLAEDAIWITVLERPELQAAMLGAGGAKNGLPLEKEAREKVPLKGVAIKLWFPGSDPKTQLVPFARQETVVSYFTGNDPAKWQSNVPVWGGVRYEGLYSGVDLELSGQAGGQSMRWLVQPGASLDAIQLEVQGADGVALVEGGRLWLSTAVGEFILALPFLEGLPSGKQMKVVSQSPGSFLIPSPFGAPVTNGDLGCLSGAQDLLYSTFLRGWAYDEACALAVDGTGAAYVAGFTRSSDFPTTSGAFDSGFNGYYDAFVARLNPSGSALLYSTFLGGSDYDSAYALAMDGAGAAYVAGYAESSDFPTTPGAFDRSYNGLSDAFVAKLQVPTAYRFLLPFVAERGH